MDEPGKKLKEKSGAALVIALVIMMLILMLSMAMLLVSYSLYNTSQKQRTVEQCREIAETLSIEIAKELEGATAEAEELNSYEKVKEAIQTNKYPLWCYLRCNLWQTSWPYYNPDEIRHQMDAAGRKFTVDYGTPEMPGKTEIVMYWESEADGERTGNTPFNVRVTCTIGKQKATVLSSYELDIEVGREGFETGEGEDVEDTPQGAGNPAGETIYKTEEWKFSLAEME